MPTSILNLGIVAHVDAGKTTLTERLLFETGVTRHLGRVDHGDTTTDADALERRRGITIRSAVVTFTVPTPDGDDLRVNLIDTPGHSEFVAEVERALAVLDGAVLVVSAVEGVQAHTRVLIRVMERLGLPFLVFANKIDRGGASYDETMAALREAVAGDVIALTEPIGPGHQSCTVRPRTGPAYTEELVERLSLHDDHLLERYVEGSRPPRVTETSPALARLTACGLMHPVLFGSALRGHGVADLLNAVARWLPAERGDAGAELHASVFKIERDPAGHKLAFARLHQGTLTARDHVVVHHPSPAGVTARPGRALAVHTFRRGAETVDEQASAGDITTVLGLADVKIGDQLGRWDPTRAGRLFPSPGLESVVRPVDPERRPALFEALRQLSEQDPLIDARLDPFDSEITVSIYGEIQKEVLADRLVQEYGVAVSFLQTQTVHIERVTGVGEAEDNRTYGNAELGLRIGPGPVGSGVDYRLEVERGYLLPSFHTAITQTLDMEMRAGLRGWRVTDCRIALIHSRFRAVTPPAGHFRDLTSRCLRRALEQAGTTVCAPVSEFEADVPADSIRPVLHALHAVGASPQPPSILTDRARITGMIAAERVSDVEQRLPNLTGGRGVLVTTPSGYEPVTGPPPRRRGSRS